ncbi:hypothetical protein DP129_09595 [Clostridium tetani]|uniref:hypothetical protein n=1 Tax=Clostridium tetani TaxID=1513 RepID=UPI00100A7C89|nr:hypothetical protein [Clostridium tetani]RXI38481.1 hypothetical protein DP129_09595 [Clostridium tetani]
MKYNCDKFIIKDITLKNMMHIKEDELIINYEIINTGKYSFSCIWAMHCLVKCEEDMEIVFPKRCNEIINVHDSEYLGMAKKNNKLKILEPKEELNLYIRLQLKSI